MYASNANSYTFPMDVFAACRLCILIIVLN